MAQELLCHRCGVGGELRTCERCKRPVCQPCCQTWRDWGANTVRWTEATCKPCFLRDLWREVAEARANGCDEVEIAPSFEELGCWG